MSGGCVCVCAYEMCTSMYHAVRLYCSNVNWLGLHQQMYTINKKRYAPAQFAPFVFQTTSFYAMTIKFWLPTNTNIKNVLTILFTHKHRISGEISNGTSLEFCEWKFRVGWDRWRSGGAIGQTTIATYHLIMTNKANIYYIMACQKRKILFSKWECGWPSSAIFKSPYITIRIAASNKCWDTPRYAT